MVVDDLHIFSARFRPAETNAPLIVALDAVTAGAISLERFKAISGWNPQIIQALRNLQLPELPTCNRRHIAKPLYTVPF